MKKNIKDNRGYNQIWSRSKATVIRATRRSDLIISAMDRDRKINVLEIGCGTGLHAYLIAKANPHIKVVSTDICESFIEQARKDFNLKNLRYEILDFNDKEAVAKLLARNGEFDYVFGDGILHHLYYHLSETIANLKRLLKKGGKLLFWEPNIINPYCFFIFKSNQFRKIANLEPSEMAFSKKHIRKILQSNNFMDINISNRDFLLPITPDFLIKLVQSMGKVLEKLPILCLWSQSIFISARKNKED